MQIQTYVDEDLIYDEHNDPVALTVLVQASVQATVNSVRQPTDKYYRVEIIALNKSIWFSTSTPLTPGQVLNVNVYTDASRRYWGIDPSAVSM